ncbi:hypothetical protein GCM10022631_11430 [Deinococcus rubellus]|uniref:hypothetical protein n=1 Tax=Deinococcus rubellus TaxID=1889240 RepID=UPI0031EE19C0
MESTLGSLVASTTLDLSGFLTGLNRIREEGNKTPPVQIRTKLDTTAMQAEIARSTTAWKDLQNISDQATQRITRNLGGVGNEATNLRNQLKQAGSEFRTMDSSAEATKVKIAGIVMEARGLKAGFEAGTSEARILTGVIEQGRAALGSVRSSTSPVVAQLRQEQALARESIQVANSYRIAWQRGVNGDTQTLAAMSSLERAILGRKAATDAEITSLRELEALDEVQTKRLQQLTAQEMTYQQALRTSASVQASINGTFLKGSLAAGVQAGTGAASASAVPSVNELTLATERLVAQEKAEILTKEQLVTALAAERGALETAHTVIAQQLNSYAQLETLTLAEAAAAIQLVGVQDQYVAALGRVAAAQKAAGGLNSARQSQEAEYSAWWKAALAEREALAKVAYAEERGQISATSAEMRRLIDTEKAGLSSKALLSQELRNLRTAQIGSLDAINLEMKAERELSVVQGAETERLTQLITLQRELTASIANTTIAQREAAASSNVLRQGMMGAGGSAKMNGAAMGLSFVSPELGMASMLLTMGPAIAGIAAGFMAVGGAIKLVSSGMNDFADWNRQMTQLQALTHLSGEDIQGLSSYFRQLSTEIPISAKELGELGRQAVLVGLHGVDGIKAYTESMAALSIVLRDASGNSAGLEQVGQEIVKVLRSTGMTTDQVNASFATTVDTLVALKTQFGVNIPEVTTLAKYWSSYAASVGFSTTQIFAWSAALISVGARAQGAGGALTKILEKASEAAANGGKQWAQWAQLVGMSSEAAKELLKNDPNAFLTAFASGMSDSSDSGKDLSQTLGELHLNTAQVVRTVSEMAVALPSMTRAQQAAADGARDHGLAMRTAQEAADSYKDKLITLGHVWDNFKLSLGAEFVPMANDVLTYLTNVIDAAAKATDAIRGISAQSNAKTWADANGLDPNKISVADTQAINKLLAERVASQAGADKAQAQIDANPNAWNIAGWKKVLAERKSELDARDHDLAILLARYNGTPGLPMGSGNVTLSSASNNGPAIGPLQPGQQRSQALGEYGQKVLTGAFETTGNAAAEDIIGYCARWVRLHLQSADPEVSQFVKNMFQTKNKPHAGDVNANDARDNFKDKGMLNTDWSLMKPGAAVFYGDNHVGIYVGKDPVSGKDMVRGNNEWGVKNGRGVVSNEGLDSLGRKAGFVNADDLYTAGTGKQSAPAAAAGYSGESQKELDRQLSTTNALMDKAGDKASQYAGRLEHVRTSALNLAHAQSQGSDEWLKAMSTWSSANSALEKLNGTTGKTVASAANLKTYGDAALRLVKAQQAADATGDPAQSAAAQRNLDAWIGKSKVKQAVLDAESAAYQTRLQNEKKADQDAAKAEQDRLTKQQAAAQLQKAIAADLAASNVSSAQSNTAKLDANRLAQLALAKNDAGKRLEIETSLGQSILTANKATITLQLKQDQSAADEKAKLRQVALTKQYGVGKEPVDQQQSIESTRLKERADAQTKADNAASAAFLSQQERMNAAQSAVTAKNKQMADQQQAIQKQVQQQLDAASAQQRQDMVQQENDKLKTLQNAQKLALDAAKGDAAARLKVYNDTDQAIENQAIKAAEVQKQLTIQTAKDKLAASIAGIPKGASADQVKTLTAGYQATYDSAVKAAKSSYDLAVSAARQSTQADMLAAGQAVSAEVDKERKAVSSLADDYQKARAALKGKADSGSLTADDVSAYLKNLSGLWEKAGDAGVKSNAQIQAAHAASKAFVATAVDLNGAAIQAKALGGAFDQTADGADRARAAQNQVVISLQMALDNLPKTAEAQKVYVAALTDLEKQGYATAGSVKAVEDAISNAAIQAKIDADIQSGAYASVADGADLARAAQNQVSVSLETATAGIPEGAAAQAVYVQALTDLEKQGYAAAGSVKAVQDAIANLATQAQIDKDIRAGLFDNVPDAANRTADATSKVVVSIADIVAQIPAGVDAQTTFIAALSDMEKQGYATAGSVKAVQDAISAAAIQAKIDHDLFTGEGGPVYDGGRGQPGVKAGISDATITANLPSTLAGVDAFSTALDGLAQSGDITTKQLEKFKAVLEGIKADLNGRTDIDNIVADAIANPGNYADGARGASKAPLDDPQPNMDNFSQQLEGVSKNRLTGGALQSWLGTLDPEQLKQANAVIVTAHQDMLDTQRAQTAAHLEILKQLGLVAEREYLNQKEVLDVASADSVFAKATDRLDKTDQAYIQAAAVREVAITGIHEKANADRTLLDMKNLYALKKSTDDLQQGHKDGTVNGADFFTQATKMIQQAELMAQAAQRAGNPALAKQFYDQAAAIEKIGGAALKAYMALNKFSDWTEAVGQVAGAFGNLTGAMGQTEQEYDSLTGKKLSTPWKDLTANLQGAGKAFNTLQTIAGDALAVITNPLDIKAWGKLFADVINSIADALAGFKKAQAEVLKNKADFADQNPLLNPGDYQKTFTRSRGFFADVFGGGPEVVNQIDKIGLKVAQGLATGVFNGLDAGFKKYAETGNLDDFQKALTTSIVDAAKQGLIDGFKNDPARQATFAGDIKAYTDAGKAGDSAVQASALEKLKTDAKTTTDQAKELLATLDAIDKANGTGRYDPAVIAAKQRSVQGAGINNIETALKLQNRAKLISDAELQDRLHVNTAARIENDRQSALAADGLTEQDKLNINEEFNLKQRSNDQDYLDWQTEATRKAAEIQRGIKLQTLTDAGSLADAQHAEALAAATTADQKTQIDAAYETGKLQRTLQGIELARQAALAAADLTAEQIASINDNFDTQRQVANLAADTARIQAAQQVADAIKSEQDGILNTWGGTFATAFTAGLDAANFDTFFNKFKADMTRSVLEGTVAGLFQSMAEEELRPAVERYRQALKTPGTADDLSALADVRAGIVSIGNSFRPVFDSLQPAFAANNAELAANTLATQQNTQATKEQQFSTTIASFNLPTTDAGLRQLFPSL